MVKSAVRFGFFCGQWFPIEWDDELGLFIHLDGNGGAESADRFEAFAGE